MPNATSFTTLTITTPLALHTRRDELLNFLMFQVWLPWSLLVPQWSLETSSSSSSGMPLLSSVNNLRVKSCCRPLPPSRPLLPSRPLPPSPPVGRKFWWWKPDLPKARPLASSLGVSAAVAPSAPPVPALPGAPAVSAVPEPDFRLRRQHMRSVNDLTCTRNLRIRIRRKRVPATQ